MELKEFIEQTIIDITDGIRSGHEYLEKNKYGKVVEQLYSYKINFDVAVSTSEEKTSGIKGKILVVNIISAGGKKTTTTQASNLSRIQFKVVLDINTNTNISSDY